MVNSSEFAKRLQIILEEFGLTATAFAEEINFNRSTISHLLSGRNKPSLEFVLKVVERFPEVSLYWLLNGKGTFPKEKTNTPHVTEPASTYFSTPIPPKTVVSKKTAPTLEEKAPESQKDIDRIVIFYKNGSFKEYLP